MLVTLGKSTLVKLLLMLNAYPSIVVTFGRYILAAIYGLNAWRLLVMIGYYFESLPAIKGILTLFAVSYPIVSLYYLFMCIILFTNKGIKEYMYGKLYK